MTLKNEVVGNVGEKMFEEPAVRVAAKLSADLENLTLEFLFHKESNRKITRLTRVLRGKL